MAIKQFKNGISIEAILLNTDVDVTIMITPVLVFNINKECPVLRWKEKCDYEIDISWLWFAVGIGWNKLSSLKKIKDAKQNKVSVVRFIGMVLALMLIPFLYCDRTVSNNINMNITDIDIQINKVINRIKADEDIYRYPYRVKDDLEIIGYGHIIHKSDELKYPISDEVADSLLLVDFDYAMSIVDKHTYNLSINQLLALSHYVYYQGESSFIKMYVIRVVKEDVNIDEEIVKYIHVINGNDTIISNDLLNLRNYELNLYNYGKY